MAEKTKVTLVQNATNQVVAVRIGDVEIPVVRAGPVIGAGQTDLTLTIGNVEIDYAKADAPAA
jgi:hypothetical protein